MLRLFPSTDSINQLLQNAKLFSESSQSAQSKRDRPERVLVRIHKSSIRLLYISRSEMMLWMKCERKAKQPESSGIRLCSLFPRGHCCACCECHNVNVTSQSENQDHDKAFSSEVAELIINLALFPVQRILAHKTVTLELNSLDGDFLPYTVN